MNITLAIDDDLLRDARQAARAMGKSLNQLVREYLEQLTGRDRRAQEVDELRRLSREGGGRSRGRRLDRDELHER
ncbi:MAG: ribbon-helix-helix protein, CopG family, partial [Gemmatimonadales bacterium]|nr:ribbon-helix-helix protein, CopG family [Gemmatimonadales bacterium]